MEQMILQDICKVYDCPHTTAKDEGIGIPLVRTPNIGKGRLLLTNAHRVNSDIYKERTRRAIPEEDDIIIAREAPVGNAAIIQMGQKVCLGQRVVLLKPIRDRVDPNYLVYYLLSDEIQHRLRIHANGAVVAHLNMADIRNLPVSLPSLSEQKKTGRVLKIIDDKIELNRRINDNLEQQAQALFKSWFVDFEPFKNGKFVESEMGMIPEGWKVGTIGEYCSIRSGYAFKSSWWQETGTKVIKIKNITDNKTLDMSDCSYVSSDKTYKAIDFQASPGDLIIAMTGATIGKFCIIPFHNDKIYINQRVGKFFLGNNPLDRLPFIYCCLSYEPIYNEIISKGQGSAQPNIGGADIANIRIILSPSTELKEFNSRLRPIFQKKMQIESELSKLSVLRDTLLPRLMSGELKINDLNC